MSLREVLNRELDKVKLTAKEEAEIIQYVNSFMKKLDKELKKYKAKAFLGGSFSKGTVIRKKNYDVDIFILFKKEGEISNQLGAALKKMKVKAVRLPGSRDYFGVKVKGFRIEIVPVIDIKNADYALNVTDVSPLHVGYIKKEVSKNKKLADEIRLAKAFCYANDCYGAENHIRGFSGYCLEVLTAHFGSFEKLIREAAKWTGKDKIVIDPKKYYKDRKIILQELNEAKLLSPLILIDPVQKDRNIAAALSYEKLEKFVKACKAFLKSPSLKYFERKEFNEKEVIESAKKKKNTLIKVSAVSDKRKEDISGAKLLKLHKLLAGNLKKEGYRFKELWVFDEKRANSYFIISQKPKQSVQRGPPVKLEKHAMAFKKKWKKYFVKSGMLYAKKSVRQPEEVLKADKRKIKEMDIKEFSVKRLVK